jgi:ABC-type dipeptide/oligopeptide/nickel transport system permease subunit
MSAADVTSVVEEGSDALTDTVEHRSLWRDAARRFTRNKLAMLALCFVILLTLIALFASVLAPEGYDHQVYSEAWQSPSREHPMGTDPFGRDVWTRIMYGARISLAVALVVNVTALLIGMPVGSSAGWFGGWFDYGLMRLVDIMSAFPTLLFAILLMSILGSGLINLFIAMSVTAWIGIARLVRGQVLTLREQDYTLAAQCIGASNLRIIRRHMLPNALAPLIVALTLGIPGAIMTEAGLSFLGIGVNAPTPSWGKMLSEYLPYMQTYPYLSVFPAIMIAITMFSFTLMGDGLREALDPTSKEG